MKMYVKPSLEVNKFEVEDIMTVSGSMGGLGAMSPTSQSVYEQYLQTTAGAEEVANIVEFQW